MTPTQVKTRRSAGGRSFLALRTPSRRGIAATILYAV